MCYEVFARGSTGKVSARCKGVSTGLLAALAIGCGVQEGQEPASMDEGEISQKALSGTVAFGETAVAPVSVTNGKASPLSFNSNDIRVRAIYAVPNQSVVYIGGEFSFYVGTQKYVNLAKFQIPSLPSSPLVLDQAFHPSLDKPVWAIVANTDRVYVGGEFTMVNATTPNRAGLAALYASNGSLDTAFEANLDLTKGSSSATNPNPPNNAAIGVHALAFSPTGDRAGTKMLVVGGNFVTIGRNKAVRSGLAAVSVTDGSVYQSYFATGVSGFVNALEPEGDNWVYVGGYFSATVDNVDHYGLMKTDRTGKVTTAVFNTAGDVIAMDFDSSTARIVVGTSGNELRALPSAGGDAVWNQGVWVSGDVQAVHCYSGNVYFGFHDGMFVDGNGAGAAGDQYKLAAVNSSNGVWLNDRTHSGECGASSPDNCWAPANDSQGKAFVGGSGAWGTWAITSYSSSGGPRLLVGGDVNQWGPAGNRVNSKLFTSFAP